MQKIFILVCCYQRHQSSSTSAYSSYSKEANPSTLQGRWLWWTSEATTLNNSSSILRELLTNDEKSHVELIARHSVTLFKNLNESCSSTWLESEEGLLVVTNILRTCAEVIFRILPHSLSNCHSPPTVHRRTLLC